MSLLNFHPKLPSNILQPPLPLYRPLRQSDNTKRCSLDLFFKGRMSDIDGELMMVHEGDQCFIGEFLESVNMVVENPIAFEFGWRVSGEGVDMIQRVNGDRDLA